MEIHQGEHVVRRYFIALFVCRVSLDMCDYAQPVAFLFTISRASPALNSSRCYHRQNSGKRAQPLPPLLMISVILSQTRPHLIRFSFFIFLAVIMKQKGPQDPGWLVFMRWRIVQCHPCRKAVAYII